MARAVPEAARVELVVPEDLAARAVPEDQVTREAPAVRVDPVVQAAQVGAGVAQEVPGAPEEDRVDPAGTNDPAVESCRIKAQKLPDDFGRILSGVSGL